MRNAKNKIHLVLQDQVGPTVCRIKERKLTVAIYALTQHSTNIDGIYITYACGLDGTQEQQTINR